MEHWWNDNDEETEVLAEKLAPMPLFSPKNPKWNGLRLNHSLCSGKTST